jgi:ADP-ribosylglycohydrolase
MTKMLDKYTAAIVLHSLGDTIGFKNGDWEFNYFNYFKDLDINEDAALEIVYEFISLGGITGIDLKGWYASDDTYYNHAIAKALIISDHSKPDFYETVKKCMVEMTEEMLIQTEKTGVSQQAGITTIDYVKLFKEDIHGKDGRTMPYDKFAGGSGGAMKAIPIGMAYFGEENRDKLIEVAIESARLTHNSPISYLAALVIALFSAYAIEGISIEKWPFLMMEILKSDKVTSYLKIEEEKYDYNIFMKFWYRYLDIRFKNNQIVKSKVNRNLLYRTYFYISKLKRDDDPDFKDELFGSSGISCCIVVYDCLIDAGDKFETLIYYSALNIGDSDTISCLSCGLYGLMYGFLNVPDRLLEHLELKNESYDHGNKLYKKYYLRENIN